MSVLKKKLAATQNQEGRFAARWKNMGEAPPALLARSPPGRWLPKDALRRGPPARPWAWALGPAPPESRNAPAPPREWGQRAGKGGGRGGLAAGQP